MYMMNEHEVKKKQQHENYKIKKRRKNRNAFPFLHRRHLHCRGVFLQVFCLQEFPLYILPTLLPPFSFILSLDLSLPRDHLEFFLYGGLKILTRRRVNQIKSPTDHNRI
ncbi:hypothetical protein L1887_23493 [Cichorium endivia]|nr:hypothetical protein L1887_23493 [Cichorium endivia]